MSVQRHCVFITGGTGYIGRRLTAELLERGHEVRALVRPDSEKKLPPGCTPLLGNVLDGTSYTGQISPADTFVHLVGVAHPSPAKAAEFAGTAGVPVVSHAVELAIHAMRGTPNLRANIAASLCFTVFSTLFNLHAMREGVLVVGNNGGSIVSDLRSLPRSISTFLLSGFGLFRS